MKTQQQDIIELYTRPELVATTVWLHGMGTNATDMDGIITNMRKSRELGLHHLAPSAPVRPVTVNNGRPGRAWFDVLGDPAEVPEDRIGIEESSRYIRDLLNEERGRNIPSKYTVLGGFSQGASLALHAGLRYPHALAGIVMLSGELVLADLLAEERHPGNTKTPILMLHGTEDETIPLEDARRSRDRLQELGYRVDWHELPMGHAVTGEEIAIIDDWVYERLEPALTAS
jgi:phospholipase/carboxylesterase